MRRIFSGVVSLLLLGLAATPAFSQAANPAQNTTSQGPTAPPPSPRIEHPGVPKGANAPDMVCFGYYPRWSVQFTNGEARYIGFNESDRYFEGDFYWVPDENAWEWHRANGLPTANGSYGLSATIEKSACHDPVQKSTDPYSAQVYLPEGDMISGCCRKLKPGEAVIGRHGAPASAVSPNPPAAATAPPASNAPQAGHPVDLY